MTSEILGFLQPQPDTWAFLSIMAVVFFSGLVAGAFNSRRFYQRLRVAAQRYRGNEGGCATAPPDAYLRLTTRPEAVHRMLAPIPGVLVTIGILGTFIGLGLAVAHAIPALQSGSSVSEVQEALAKLLGAVKFKFQTSAWGILASLVFTFLATLADLVLTRSFEHAAAALLTFRTDRSAELLARLPEALDASISKGFAGGFEHLRAQLDASLATLAKNAEKMGNQTILLAQSVQGLQASIQVFSVSITKTTEDLGASSRELGQLGAKVDTSLEKIPRVLEERMQVIGERQTATFQAVQVKLDDALGQLGASITHMVETLTTATNAQQDRLQGVLEHMRSRLAETLSTMQAAQEKSSAVLVTTAREQQASLAKALTDLDENITHSLQRLGDGQQQISQHMQQSLTGALQSVEHSLEEFDRRQSEGSKDQQASLDQALTKLNTTIADSLNRLGQTQQQTFEELKKYQSDAVSAQQALARSFSQIDRHLDRLLKIVDQLQSLAAVRPDPPPRRTVNGGNPQSGGAAR